MVSLLRNTRQERPALSLKPGLLRLLAKLHRTERLIIGLTVLLASSSKVVLATDSNHPGADSARPANSTKATPLRVVYFHSPSCHECREVKKFLPQVTSLWGNRIAIEMRNVEDINIFNELLQYEKHYKATVAAPPAIFVGDKALVGDQVTLKRLDAAISDSLANGIVTFSPKPASPEKVALAQQEAVPSEILRRFESFGPGAVAVAGLMDGVNPCAFTTIVFFLSMLAYLGKSKRDLAIVGTGFTASVFLTYFLLGLGLLGAIKSFSVSSGLSSGLACGVGILAFVLAGWSFWDFVQYKRTGDTKKMTLGLPKSIKTRIHKVIRTHLTTRGLVVGSVTVGFLVSILESLCTGQVYLPTIVFVTRAPGLRAGAIGYLLLYNLMFILPLVGILAPAYFGVRSETLGNMLRKRLALAKLGMAGLFTGLGVLLLATR